MKNSAISLIDDGFVYLFRLLQGNDEKNQKHLHNQLQYVLQSGLDMNIDFLITNVHTALRWAVSQSCVTCTAMLLKAGADASLAENTTGTTPLHIALRKSFDDTIVNLLIAHGADVCAQNSRGHVPLFYVRSVSCLNALVNAGADVNACDAIGRSALFWLAMRTTDSDDAPQLMQTLIEFGANIEQRDLFDHCALHSCFLAAAANHTTSMRRMRLCAVLISNNASVTSSSNVSTFALFENENVVRLPLIVGLKPTKADIDHLLRKVTGDRLSGLLRSIICYYPQVLDSIDTSETVKDLLIIANENEMLREKEQLFKEKQMWHRILLRQCACRMLEIILIFKHLPALIVVQICLFDQPCLMNIDESLVWNFVASNQPIRQK